MLYLTCPTCGYFLGQKTIQYEEKKKIICSNPTLLQEEKDEQLAQLLNSLNLKRYCCKMRMMAYKDIVEIIIPPSDD